MTRRKRRQKTPEKKFHLEAGVTYLFEDETMEKLFDVFLDLTSTGIAGLCISRNYPPRLLKGFHLKKNSVIWLTRRKGDDTLDPVQLSLISHSIQQFITENDPSIVILDGLEYLIIQNEFKPVLRFIQHIRDEVFTRKANLLIPLSTQALDTAEVKLLERDLELFIDDSNSKS